MSTKYYDEYYGVCVNTELCVSSSLVSVVLGVMDNSRLR